MTLSDTSLGILIGLSTFLIIGIFHPLVIKGEYYFGQKVNFLFATLGIIMIILAACSDSLFASAILSVVAFSSFWSIGEVREQKKRVERGWFPENPNRKRSTKKFSSAKVRKNRISKRNLTNS